MTEILALLAKRLATELVVEVNQVAEPFKTNLLNWMEKMADRQMNGSAADSYQCLRHELAAWLSEFDALGMIDQHRLLSLLCQDAARIFGINEK